MPLNIFFLKNIQNRDFLFSFVYEELKFRIKLVKFWESDLDRYERYNMRFHLNRAYNWIHEFMCEVNKLQDWSERLALFESVVGNN